MERRAKKKGSRCRGRVRLSEMKFLIEISPREVVDGMFVESPANGASSIVSVHVRELLALGTVDRARRYPSVYRPCLCGLSLSSLRISLGNQLNPAFGNYAFSCIWRRREWHELKLIAWSVAEGLALTLPEGRAGFYEEGDPEPSHYPNSPTRSRRRG